MTSKVWVLWHMYSDGGAAHVERVYLDKMRADDDFALLNGAPGGDCGWKLEEVPLYPKPNPANHYQSFLPQYPPNAR